MDRACQIVKKLRKVKDGVLLKTVADQLRQLIGLGCVAIVLEGMDGEEELRFGLFEGNKKRRKR